MKTTCLLLFLGFALNGYTQSKFIFHKFSSDDGIAGNNVKCIAQDKNGFIWIGTSNGLQRIEGNKFISPYDYWGSKRFLGIGVRQIIQDKDGKFFLFQVDNQFACFDPLTFEYKLIKIQSRKEVPVKDDYQFFRDSRNHIFICANNYGLLVYDPKNNSFSDQNLSINIPSNWQINSLFEDKMTGNYWIASDSGLAVYNYLTKELFYRNHNPKKIPLLNSFRRAEVFLIDAKRRYWLTYWTNQKESLKKEWQEHLLYYDEKLDKTIDNPNGTIIGNYAQFRQIIETHNGVIWVDGFQALLNLYPGQDKFTQNKDTGLGNYGIKFRKANNLFEDRERNLWVCTDKGLFVIYPNWNFVSNYSFVQKNDVYALSFVANNENELWVGAWGNGVNLFDSTLNPLKNNIYNESRFISSLCLQRETGALWTGFSKGELNIIDGKSKKIIKKFDPKIFNYEVIWQIVEDLQGNIWVATQTGKLFKWIKSGNFKNQEPDFIMEDPAGICSLYADNNNNIWVGTFNGRIYVLNTASGKRIKQYSQDSFSSLKANNIISVRQLNDSIYFIGCNGLDILNTNTGNYSHLGHADGLSGNSINCMELDKNKILWIGTVSNLCSYNYNTNHFSIYNKSDGIMDPESIRTLSFTKNGKLFVGGINSISFFDPAFLLSSEPPPDVRLTNFKLFSSSVNVDSLLKQHKIELPYNKNTFTVSFASPTYLQKDKLTYFYKLQGADDDWLRADKFQSVNYSLLPPGKYTFLVRCQNDLGIKSAHVTEMALFIRPPFWLTWWFLTLSVVITALIVNYFYKLRIKQLLAVEKVRQRVARDLHDDMGSTLSTINILSLMAKNKITHDPVKVSEYIGKINDNSSRMMEAMDDIVWNINPANDDIQKIIARMREFATNVLEAKEIELAFFVEEQVRDLHLSMEQRRDLFLIFKEAVNNAAKYSRSNKVIVSLTRENKMLCLCIKDDGIGFEVEEADNGNGLKNMKKRTEHLKGKINIISTSGKGTSVCLKFIAD